jgi:pimeloyl-ACP methyl ester carboxylesterase
VLEATPITLPSGRRQTIHRGGSGPFLVWCHGLSGLDADRALLDALAHRYTVVAPMAPGFNDLAELDGIDDVHDLSLHYDDIVGAVTGEPVLLAGHSFGAMIAAELACHSPARVAALALLSPIGLWDDAHPVADLFALPAVEVPDLIYFKPPSIELSDEVDPVEAVMALARGMTTVAKFVWPLPDRGLRKRLYRVDAPTLIVHGTEDAFVPVAYAHDFGRAIADTTVELVADAGHMVGNEQPDAVVAAVTGFFASSGR